MEQPKIKKCGDCERSIPFHIFLRDNPAISKNRAQELWTDPFIVSYCLECFLNRPEKPYRRLRRHYHINNLKMRK